MKKLLILLLSVSLVCSCATVRTSNYVVNDIPVEIIDGHEYFVQRAENGTITMMEHKEDCQNCQKKDTAKFATLTATTGVVALSVILNFIFAYFGI